MWCASSCRATRPKVAKDAANAYGHQLRDGPHRPAQASPIAKPDLSPEQPDRRTTTPRSISSPSRSTPIRPRPNAGLADPASQAAALRTTLTTTSRRVATASGRPDTARALTVVKTAELADRCRSRRRRSAMPASPRSWRSSSASAWPCCSSSSTTRSRRPNRSPGSPAACRCWRRSPSTATGPHRFSRRFHRAERALVSPTSAAAESYHALATNLRFSNLGKEKRTILVTSSVGRGGQDHRDRQPGRGPGRERLPRRRRLGRSAPPDARRAAPLGRDREGPHLGHAGRPRAGLVLRVGAPAERQEHLRAARPVRCPTSPRCCSGPTRSGRCSTRSSGPRPTSSSSTARRCCR